MSFLHSLRRLLDPMDNCAYVVYRFCQLLQVNVSRTYIRQQLEAHPAYPSLLAVTDVLSELHIENMSLRVSVDQLSQLPQPMIAHLVINGDDFFTVVTGAGDSITYLHPASDRQVSADKEQFGKIFTGFVLLADGAAGVAEKNYALRVREEKQWLLSFSLPAVLVVAGVLALCVVGFLLYGQRALAPVAFSLLALCGAVISALLVWYDADRHNPLLQKVCTAGKQVDCHEVLDAAQSTLFGIKWSVIGFAYFTGILTCMAVAGMGQGALSGVLGWFSLLALPYTVFSIYYQARVAKKWCVLCLAVQVVLLLQAGVIIAGGYLSAFPWSLAGVAAIVQVLIPMLVLLALVHVLVANFRQIREGRVLKMELYRLKHSPEVFDAVLNRQRSTSRPPIDMGIRIGNPDAQHTIVKVCNPFCGPCAQAHVLIDELVKHNPSFNVQIIFTASTSDYRTSPVRHLMAIAEKGDVVQTQQALDDWYGSKHKVYETFAEKYPMNGELAKQDNKIQLMYDWCKNEQIRVTPTMFISDTRGSATDTMYQLPDNYGVADLKYFFSFKLE